MKKNNYKILVVGSGGREHAIAWALAKDKRVESVYVAPGNGGTSAENKIHNITAKTFDDLILFAKENEIYITVVGPETPLSEGIVDKFKRNKLTIFGPTKQATMLESSKDFAKKFMIENNIPTAKHKTFTDSQNAHKYISSLEKFPSVIKADGLAAGKGVIIAKDAKEAHDAVEMLLVDCSLGDAGKKIIIEEFLVGRELSYIVATDGSSVIPLATSKDYKRLLDGDQGPNTGGMGAFSPAYENVDERLDCKIMKDIITPTLNGLKTDRIDFQGFLYAGLMIDQSGDPKVLEFNCRLGDPETQPLLLRLKSSFFSLVALGAKKQLDKYQIEWDKRSALGVVIASKGYPQNPVRGQIIGSLPENSPDLHIFHSGTQMQRGQAVVSGGRIMCVTSLGDNIQLARRKVLSTIASINLKQCHYRRDIGQ